MAGPQISCAIKSLNAGGTLDVTVSGQVIDAAGSTIFNTASVTGNISNKGVTATDSEITTVKPAIDLTITKAGSPNPVCAASWPGPGYPAGDGYPAGKVCQGGLTYTFIVGNSGTQTASGVVVRDPLPTGLIYVPTKTVAPAFSGGCSLDGSNAVMCTGGTVGPQSTTPITINVVAPPTTGTITNTVTVDPYNAIFESDETNNTFTQVTTVGTGIDLTVKKHSNHEANFVATRGTLTYTIKATNLGTQDASNILVRDTLPADTVFRSAVSDPTHGFTCSQANGVVDCVGGRLQGTESVNYPNLGGQLVDQATITIRILATAYEQPAMHNEVRIDPLGQIPETDKTNNVSTQDTAVQRGGATNDAFNDLTIFKKQVSPDPNNTARNAVVTYQVQIGNDGTDPVTGVKVRDTLPAGSRYIQATGTNSFLCTQQVVGIVNCVGGQIADHTPADPPNANTAIITVKMFAPDTPGTYTNQVEADPDHTIAEGNEFNNNASAQTIVKNAGAGSFNDLIASFEPSPASTLVATPLGTITYKVDIHNTGTDPALNVPARVILPTGVTFVSAADSAPGAGAFTCSQAGGVVDCAGATIPGVTGVRTIVISVTAPNQVTSLTAQAIADPNNVIPEGDETNNTDSFTTSVQSSINLNITKTGPKESSQSSPGEYDITMTNQPVGAGQTAFHVKMQDPFPVGLIPLAVDTGDGNNWQCAVSENPINMLDCVGDLEPSKPVTLKFYVFMTAESGKPLANEACFVPNPDVPPGFPQMVAEYNPPGTSDNCSTASTQITSTSPDLFVTKSGDPGLAAPGDTVTYTILVQNNGSAKAISPLTLTDTLPTSAVSFIDANATNGWTCTGTGPVVCHDDGSLGLDVGASTTITIHVKVKDTTTLPFVNIAEADTAMHDPSDASATDETNTGNNKAMAKTSVAGTGTDLAITSIIDKPDPVIPGQGLKYTVIAVNGGTVDLTGVVVRLILPSAGAAFVSADGSNGFNCNPGVAANTEDCVGDMPAGGDTEITASFTVTGPAGSNLALTATIDPDNLIVETDEGNNTKTETTTISGSTCTGCIDLVSAQLIPVPDPVAAGGTLVVKYNVVNIGDTPTALDPTKSDQRLLNLAAASGFTSTSATSSDSSITCTTVDVLGLGIFSETNCFGNLGPGQGVTITLTLTGISADTSVTGTADPDNKVAESIETNNVLTETIKQK
ncbi:MAG TPA: CARDB domain-containing protein [Vicinamibacterales bacterium]